jgi:DNA repair exonuclease SbcCD ATPase subunit
MIINKIKIQNFKSIYDELVLDFNDIKGLWKIGGTVGSGKTTIGEAIIFGLFGSIKGKNNGELISWGNKHGMIE